MKELKQGVLDIDGNVEGARVGLLVSQVVEHRSVSFRFSRRVLLNTGNGYRNAGIE